MNKKVVSDLNLKGKRVLIRADFNVPLENGAITNDNRIIQALPTIKYVIENGGRAVIFSHLGRIKNIDDVNKYSIRPIVVRLSQLLNMPIKFIHSTRSKNIKDAINSMKDGEILMFENTRFEDIKISNSNATFELTKGESKNNVSLGKYWASLGDVFINDAFGTAHRSHASNVGIAENIKESAVGFLIEKEIENLGSAVDNPESPFIAILGGSKVSDKIGLIENLLTKADKIIIGGAMVFTFLKALGKNVGNSLCEDNKLELAKNMLDKSNGKIILPLDVVCATEFNNEATPNIYDVDSIPSNMMGLDIGPKSVALFSDIISTAKTVVLNGPMGVFEMSNFAEGTIGVCDAIANLKNSKTIIGGGDSATAAIKFGYENCFTHISTGGGASLEYLEGKVLPGISAIDDK